jgi:hypothetical protein
MKEQRSPSDQTSTKVSTRLTMFSSVHLAFADRRMTGVVCTASCPARSQVALLELQILDLVHGFSYLLNVIQRCFRQ